MHRLATVHARDNQFQAAGMHAVSRTEDFLVNKWIIIIIIIIIIITWARQVMFWSWERCTMSAQYRSGICLHVCLHILNLFNISGMDEATLFKFGTWYIVSQKETHLMSDNNFGKCWPIFILFSPDDL